MYTKQYIISIDALHLTGKHLHLHNLVVKFQNFPTTREPKYENMSTQTTLSFWLCDYLQQ